MFLFIAAFWVRSFIVCDTGNNKSVILNRSTEKASKYTNRMILHNLFNNEDSLFKKKRTIPKLEIAPFQSIRTVLSIE